MWRMSVPRPYLGGRASGLPAASSTGPPLVRGIRADPSTKWRGDRWKRPFDFPILPSSPLLVRQKFAVIGHHDPIPFGIFYLLDVHLKVDGAHDTVPKHLVDERFNSRTVDLRDLVEPVDERINGYSTVERALHGHLLQRFSHLRTEPQDTRCGRSFVGRHGRLAHQGRSDPDLMPSHSFGNGLKGKFFGFLGSQDLNSSLCASDHDIFLLSMMVNRVTATLFAQPLCLLRVKCPQRVGATHQKMQNMAAQAGVFVRVDHGFPRAWPRNGLIDIMRDHNDTSGGGLLETGDNVE